MGLDRAITRRHSIAAHRPSTPGTHPQRPQHPVRRHLRSLQDPGPQRGDARGGKVRRYLRQRRIGIVIPRQRHERQREEFDEHLYMERNRVERLINRLKQFRRVATRYEKQSANYLAILTLTAIVIWL